MCDLKIFKYNHILIHLVTASILSFDTFLHLACHQPSLRHSVILFVSFFHFGLLQCPSTRVLCPLWSTHTAKQLIFSMVSSQSHYFSLVRQFRNPNIFTNSRLKPQPSIVEIISYSLSQIGLEEHLLFTCHHETLNKYLYAVIFRLQVQIIQDNLFLGTSANSVTLSYFLQSSSYKTISKFINQSVS